MPDNQVAFPALIKELNVKSLVSGDKEARLILQFLADDDILDGINRLHRADGPVMIALVAIDNTEKNNAIQKGTRSKRR
jgi:hypothetical protein